MSQPEKSYGPEESSLDTEAALYEIGAMLKRLDARKCARPGSSRMDLSFTDGRWVAQILADPLRAPVVGASSAGPDLAILRLRDEAMRIDWRRVRR